MQNVPYSLTRRLAQFGATTGFDDLPAAVVHECKRLLLDTVGCALGAINMPSACVARDYARLLGGAPTATALGLDTRSSPKLAAYVNARLANVLDADDTFPTGTHFGNATVFAALALGEHFNRNGRDLIKAIAVGFDIGARIGIWMGWPVQFKDGKVVGFHKIAGPAAAVTWAAIGSAASISALDEARTIHAFGIGGANSPLPSQSKYSEQATIPMFKYADSGWCAQIGVASALLAGLGSTGFADILDGEHGFWRFYGAPVHDAAALLDGLGSDWQILNTTYKPWPCCRFIHYPLTAFDDLRQKHRISAQEIEKVVVRSSPFAQSAKFRARQPLDALSAEFSYPHALAAVAYDIQPGPLWYLPETIHADHIRAFRERVDVELEPSSNRIAESMRGAQWRVVPGGVDIHARGAIFSATVDMAKGDPWSPRTLMSDEAIRSKFRGMLGLDPVDGTGASRIRDAALRVLDAIEQVDRLELSRLMQPLGHLARALTGT